MQYSKVILLLVFLVISISATAQVQHTLSDKNLGDNVEYYQETSFSTIKKNGEYLKGNRKKSWTKDENIWFDKNGNYIKKQRVNSDETIFEEDIFKYNNSNQLVEVSKFRNNQPSGKIILKYNSKNLISITQYYADGSVEYLTNYQYDNKERKIEEITYEDGEFLNKNTYSYDENDNLIVWYEDFPDNTEDLKHFYTYNSENQLIESLTINHRDKTEFTSTYSYFSNGNIQEQIILYGDGREKNKLIYTYNDNNTLIKKVVENGVFPTMTYLYELDDFENVIKKEEYKDDELLFIYDFRIEYFD